MTSPGVLKVLTLLFALASVVTAGLQPSSPELREPKEISAEQPVVSAKKSSMLSKFQTTSHEEEEHNTIKNSVNDNLKKDDPDDNTDTTITQTTVSPDQEIDLDGVKLAHHSFKPESSTENNQNSNSTTIPSSAPGSDVPEETSEIQTHFTAQQSTALSGNEPSSGPSPQGFSSVEDSFPVIFPRPVVQGRKNFIRAPTLERGAVDEHFAEKSLKKEAALEEQRNLVDELLLENGKDHSSHTPTFDVRVRTPRPGKKPMLMQLRPKALNAGSPKRLFLDSPNVSKLRRPSAHNARIGVEAKGDNGQIKRLPEVQNDQSLLHLLNQQQNRHPGFINPQGGFFSSAGRTDFLRPHIANDLILRQSDSLFHNNQDFFGVTPSPGITASTLSPGLLGLNVPNLEFSPRQLSEFDDRRSIFHRPTSSPSSFVDGQVIFNANRRPLTREHFSNLDDQHLSSFVTPRQPNVKVPFNNGFFGGGEINSNVFVENPSHFPSLSVTRRPFISHDDPFVSNSNPVRGNSFALRPVSPRPSTLHESLNPATFLNPIPSTPSHKFNPFSGIDGFGNVVTPSSISYHSTPRPIHLIHEQSPTPSSLGYLPTTPFPSRGLSPTTFGPPNLPIITTTHLPIFSSTYDPIIRTEFSKVKGPHSGRGTSRYRPPQTALRSSNVLTKFDPPLNQHTDYSSQYHSGEHLSHGTSNKIRPWTAEQDLTGDGDEKEYRYHYSVQSPSTGDHKSAHETRQRDGTVVGCYSLLQPDGITRKVTYTADKYSGFQANVEYLPPRPELVG
ncbi:Insect cuticle protein [Trinorchestia longiramus]|nr:Insect cuticle protein [Trinorchestia longiramus]